MARKPKTEKYYSLDRINSKKATYNVIIGERSNGKTFAALAQCIQEFVKTGKQFAYVRRWKEDVTGRRASQVFAGHVGAGVVSKITNNEYETIHYINGKFYLANFDSEGKAKYSDADCIGYVFALSDAEHNKSTSYPNVTTIVFDEFLTPFTYLKDEFVIFMNVVSTIIRQRDDVKVYMLGNTVNKFSPYFQEMGLSHVQKMEQGSIDVYKYGDSKLTVAVEYCKSIEGKSKASNHYFAFDNPKLDMITGGAWELSIYPHLPLKYKPKDVLAEFFIVFYDNIFHGELICVDTTSFIYIHAKTTPIKNPDSELIYMLEPRPEINYNRSIFKPKNRFQERILWYFRNDGVYYQNNEVGDTINNYMKVCKSI